MAVKEWLEFLQTSFLPSFFPSFLPCPTQPPLSLKRQRVSSKKDKASVLIRYMSSRGNLWNIHSITASFLMSSNTCRKQPVYNALLPISSSSSFSPHPLSPSAVIAHLASPLLSLFSPFLTFMDPQPLPPSLLCPPARGTALKPSFSKCFLLFSEIAHL